MSSDDPKNLVDKVSNFLSVRIAEKASTPVISQQTPPSSGGPATTVTSGAGNQAIPVLTTQPEFMLRHNISDEELEMLAATKRDGLFEAFWACIGIAGGAIIPAIRHVSDTFGQTKKPIEALDLVEILLFAIPAALAIAFIIISNTRKKSADDLVSQIRSRTSKTQS